MTTKSGVQNIVAGWSTVIGGSGSLTCGPKVADYVPPARESLTGELTD